MTTVYGLIALALVSLLYLFVSVGGALWPGGPQLQPEAARNLSISLVVVGLLLCGVVFGSLGELIGSLAPPLEIGGGAGPSAEFDADRATADAQASTLRAASATTLPDATAPGPTPSLVTETSTLPATIGPTHPLVSETPTLTPTIETPGPTSTPSPTPLPTALPLDPRLLVETVLRSVIERANDAEVDAILSGDENDVDPWWSGQAHDRVLENVRRVRSRFFEVTEVAWSPVGEGIQLIASTVTTATYTTSETWTFIGTIGEQCADGSPMLQRYVERYPSEQYTLVLQDSVYSVLEWQLGLAVVEENRRFCP